MKMKTRTVRNAARWIQATIISNVYGAYMIETDADAT